LAVFLSLTTTTEQISFCFTVGVGCLPKDATAQLLFVGQIKGLKPFKY